MNDEMTQNILDDLQNYKAMKKATDSEIA